MEILKNLSNGESHLDAIASQLFDVKKVQLHTNLEGFNTPSAFGVYKGTGGDALGTVGGRFFPTQPKDLFASFREALYETDADFSKVQYETFKDDSRISFKVPIKTLSFKNLQGKDDESIVYWNIQTGFDGYTKTSSYITLYRMICKNGMKGWKTEFASTFKNTSGNQGKVESLCGDFAKSLDRSANLEEFIMKMNSVKVTQKKVDEFLKKVIGFNAKEKDLSASKIKKLHIIQEAIDVEFDRTGKSVWGLVNGITYYTNHIAKTKNRADFLYVDTGAELNNKAQKVAMELI